MIKHANVTYSIATLLVATMLHTFCHPVATCCNLLGVVGSNLTVFKRSQQHPTCRNTLQHYGQTHPTCCDNIVAICCVDVLGWFGWGFTIVLYTIYLTDKQMTHNIA